jgi:hypothetical protein
MTREVGYEHRSFVPQNLQDPEPVSEVPAAKNTIPVRPIYKSS